MATIRVGISGWRYAPWRGLFYPRGWVQRRELEFASHALSSIELNGSFYALQKPDSYAEWYEQTPPHFVFSVKGNRYITHTRRLRDVEQPLANFFASGLFNLREKLGPCLWQLPPSLRYHRDEIAAFLALLPADTEQALALARHRDPWMKGRAGLAVDTHRALRHTMEVRHESFVDESFVELLRAHNVALVVADTAGKWPYCEEVITDFMYLRLHGDKQLYASGYSEQALTRWAERIHSWNAGGEPADAHRISDTNPPRRPRDVYCYFDNDIKVRAPFDALALSERLGLAEPKVAVPADPLR